MVKSVIYILLIFFVGCTTLNSSAVILTKAQALARSSEAQERLGNGEGSYRIAILGDSISAGVNSDYDGRVTFGWVDRFRELIPGLWNDVHVGNFAWPGALAYQWTLEKRIQPLIDYKPDLVVVFIGGNDGLAYAKDGKFSQEEQNELKGFFTSILDQLGSKAPNAKIILVSYYDLFDGLSTQAGPWLSTMTVISPLMQVSKEILLAEAKVRNLGVVDLFPVFLHRAYGRELGDKTPLEPMYFRPYNKGMDIHPNTLGHEAIAETVFEYVNKNAKNLRP